MSFCRNCGHELVDGAKFCFECGTSVTNISISSQTERRTVFKGEIHKCPQCGEIINSFISLCPACGLELNGKIGSASFLSFIKNVDECEKRIANSPGAKTGWASWNSSQRTWWVIFNVCFVCIPLAIYAIWPLITIKTEPKLSLEEKQLTSLVQNFPFPNDRETILEALVYVKEKIDFISKKKIDRKTVYWMKLWCAKAEQLKQKADILFPNDAIVKQSYIEILDDQNNVNKTIKQKILIGVALLVALVVLITVIYITGDKQAVVDNNSYNVTIE